jgi:glycosyltransferase involved in cell wall biosynthesis/DNA-directed RNA polymerase subunit L
MLATTGKVTSQKIVAPEIAIIIPVFKHSVLVAEAITCALQQNTEIPFVIIIVNDGCTFKETDQVGRDFALAYPDQVIYLYRPNGGLSAARNTGIEFALTAWDSVKAIYLLDADNRISAHTIDRSFKALQADLEVGWIYPTIDMFGKEEGGDFDYRGEYSVLRHLRFNTCEAGSMIRREVFERGCRYDESMKLGFEDWEFWWQAIKIGYRGKHLPESGFQYRKRFESMLSNSERDGQGIKDYIRRKHRTLLTHRHILGLEHREAPRYAIFLSDTKEIILTSDPTLSDCSISINEFSDCYHRARLMSVRYHRSYFLVFTNSTVLKILQQQALIHGVFWHLEQVQETTNFACLTIDSNSTEQAVAIKRVENGLELNVGENDHLIMTTVKVIDECLLDDQEVWIHSLISPHPMPNIVQLQLQIPQLELPDVLPGECLYKLLSIFKTLRRALRQRDQKSWDWHNNYLPSRCLMFQDARLALDCRPVYPKIVETEQKQVGFILSILEFGGVEKVALNLAKVFHDQGWKVHLFIFGSRMQQLPEWAKVFTTINFYHEPTMTPWQGNKYLGTKSDPWSQHEEHLIAKGLLCWLDVAINFHNATVNNIMGQLRRSGVKTVMSLHVHDLSPWNRPAGHTYLTLGYEHAYDLTMPCSHNMADWCHAMGVPEEKIVVVPNAAGYPLESTRVEQIIERRRNRSSREQLKVLFLGRFDRQKGLDRLVEVVTQSRQMQLPIDWKLVGKNILEGDNTADELIPIADLIEPPALTTEGLNQLYEWADVLFLPSYWEGLPLTILEAMRLGVVVCASDVGAINEAIEHQVTGLIITDTQKEKFVASAIAFLQELSSNFLELERISEAATIETSKLSWQEASRDLREKLEALITKEHKL